jgi:hypothetical protein
MQITPVSEAERQPKIEVDLDGTPASKAMDQSFYDILKLRTL